MSKHKLKDDFQITASNIVIVPNKVYVENNVLYLINNDETVKFEGGEWFIKTPLTENVYIPLGLGALPTYYIEDTANVQDIDAFNLLFETCDEETI